MEQAASKALEVTKLDDSNINGYLQETINNIRANLDKLEQNLEGLDGILFVSCHKDVGLSMSEAVGMHNAMTFAAVTAVTAVGEHMQADELAPADMPPLLVGTKVIATFARDTLESIVDAAKELAETPEPAATVEGETLQ